MKSEIDNFTQAFPSSLISDTEKIVSYLQNKAHEFYSNHSFQILLQQETIQIPVRTYLNVPANKQFSNFPLTQQQMLRCIYTRHHDGFIRQSMLQALLEHPLDYFVFPYLFQLMGEYVVEILEIIEPHLNQSNQKLQIQFISENPRYFRTIESRIVSYWNEYYRLQYPDFKDYVGYKILFKLKNLVQNNVHDSNKMHQLNTDQAEHL